jgi:hypothetical protein
VGLAGLGAQRSQRLNAFEMSCDHRYQFDADRLMGVIDRALARTFGEP